MRIAVVNHIAASTEQTRAYAEYRVFASLAPFSRLVREVDVTLRLSNRTGPRAVCAVSVNTASGVQVRVNARGRHAYDAINRAAARISERLSAPTIVASR